MPAGLSRLRQRRQGVLGELLAALQSAVAFQHAPPSQILTSPVLAYALFFLLAFGLQVSGAVVRDPNLPLQLNVNPWFAWAVCGAIASFFIGSLAVGHREGSAMVRIGWMTSVGWIFLVLVVWTVARCLKRGA